MGYGVRLKVWGNHACFTRPEMKVERLSYDVMTPSAARGILEAVHWKPTISWVIDATHVLKPIHFQSIRRNEVGSKIPAGTVKDAMKRGDLKALQLLVDEDRQQQASTVLFKPAYVIVAHFELMDKAGADDTEAKHLVNVQPPRRPRPVFSSTVSGNAGIRRPFPADLAGREFARNHLRQPRPWLYALGHRS